MEVCEVCADIGTDEGGVKAGEKPGETAAEEPTETVERKVDEVGECGCEWEGLRRAYSEFRSERGIGKGGSACWRSVDE